MDLQQIDPNHFTHLRMVLSMVVSLGIARLLSGMARYAQHPGRYPVYGVHLLWSAYLLVLLIHFWWWQFALSRVDHWNFGKFAFVVGYAAVLYLLTAILYPDNIAEYDGYRDYFLSRRRWFFGALAVALLADVVDTWLKGPVYLEAEGWPYLVKTVAGVALCIGAALTQRAWYHWSLVLLCLAHEIWWIALHYPVLQ